VAARYTLCVQQDIFAESLSVSVSYCCIQSASAARTAVRVGLLRGQIGDVVLHFRQPSTRAGSDWSMISERWFLAGSSWTSRQTETRSTHSGCSIWPSQ